MAVVLEPGCVRRAEERHVTVETGGRATRGQTVVDWEDRLGRPANARIVLEVDQERFFALMERAIS